MPKNKIEAVLFTIGKFMSSDEISKLASVHIDKVEELLNNLKKEYEERGSSLIILNENSKWKLSIKKEYMHLTEKLLTDSELDKPTQETLAIIAYKNPAFQADVIKVRGNKAYDHIHFLKENSFITSEKSGRTRVLKLSPKFFDYFDVVEDKLNLKDEQKSE